MKSDVTLEIGQMGCDARKIVFGVSDEVRFKPACSAEILLVTSQDMILSNKQITKVLIRLCGYAGLSAPLFFTNL